MNTPKDRALLDNVQDIVHDVAKVVASYRAELEAQGMDDAEAWALAQRLEERLLGPVFETAEAELKPAPWADIEALFVAVINLQLVLGQAPSASGAVRYMLQAGVRVPRLTDEQAATLSRRTTIPAWRVTAAFVFAREGQAWAP